MEIMWLGQGGLLFASGKKKILVDPYLSDSLRKIDRSLKRRFRVNKKQGEGGGRYVDDIILLAKSIQIAERLLGTSTKYLEQKLKLKVNTEKSRTVSVYSIQNFDFLALHREGKKMEVTSEFMKNPRKMPKRS